MDVSTFQLQYPEFSTIDAALIQPRLDSAANQVDPRVFGVNTEEAIGLLAAHKLSVMPGCQQARLESDKSQSTYLIEYKRLALQASGGPWVAGQRP